MRLPNGEVLRNGIVVVIVVPEERRAVAEGVVVQIMAAEGVLLG